MGIWPASVLMARWALSQRDLFKDKTIIELGAGCGVPGLAIGMMYILLYDVMYLYDICIK
jgi:predicted nicotinamide N-methyase